MVVITLKIEKGCNYLKKKLRLLLFTLCSGEKNVV